MGIFDAKPAEFLKDGEKGEWSISHFEIEKGSFMAAFHGIPAGKYVRLSNRHGAMMSDTPMERRTNSDFCYTAHGDVLIGGLGIGLILLAVQDKEDIRSITVVEKEQDVIDLVAPQLPLNEKVKIVCDDIFTFKPGKGVRYDTIYMDIWQYVNSEVYREMVRVKRRYCHYLKPLAESPDRYLACWAEWEAKHDARLY